MPTCRAGIDVLEPEGDSKRSAAAAPQPAAAAIPAAPASSAAWPTAPKAIPFPSTTPAGPSPKASP
jgi:hypothetical protein